MSLRAPRLFVFLMPYVRPVVGSLVLVLLLGGLAALLEKSAVLFLIPTWKMLFPAEEAALSGVAMGDLAARADEALSLGDRLLDWVLGGATAESTPDERMAALGRIAVIISCIALVAGVVQYAFVCVMRKTALRVVVGLRLGIARHMMQLSLRYHSQRKIGDLLSRVSSDVSTTLSVVNLSLRNLVQEPLGAIVSLGLAFVISPKATTIVLVGLPVLAVPVMILMRRVRKGSRKSASELGATLQVLTQMFSGIRTVKAFNLEERELERYAQLNDRYVKATMKMVRAVALTRGWSILYSHAGLAVLLLTVGYITIRHGAVTEGGEMLAFFMYISAAYEAIKRATRAATRVSAAAGCADRLEELFHEVPEIVDAPNAEPIDGLGRGIRLEGVRFAYPDGDGHALDGIDLDVRPGETLALVGPSGAGKSTLVDVLARFVDPTEGRVTVDGRDLREIRLDSWGEQFSMVTQEPFLFHTTIEENIRYGKPDASMDEIVAAARTAHAHGFISAMPEGYATDVADSGDRLSGGQRQRITIARAVLHGGPLLLLDEATSALDTESEAAVQRALETLMSDHTVVVIAHRLSTIRNADRIAVLDQGKLVEVGTHDELLARGGLYSRLHAAQFQDAS